MRSLCLECGNDRKVKPLAACEQCGQAPNGTDRVKSILLTEHYIKPQALEAISKVIQKGDDPFEIPQLKARYEQFLPTVTDANGELDISHLRKGIEDESMQLGVPRQFEPEAKRVRCPACGEMIMPEAKKCRFCHELLKPNGKANPPGAAIAPTVTSDKVSWFQKIRGKMNEKQEAQFHEVPFENPHVSSFTRGKQCQICKREFPDESVLSCVYCEVPLGLLHKPKTEIIFNSDSKRFKKDKGETVLLKGAA